MRNRKHCPAHQRLAAWRGMKILGYFIQFCFVNKQWSRGEPKAKVERMAPNNVRYPRFSLDGVKNPDPLGKRNIAEKPDSRATDRQVVKGAFGKLSIAHAQNLAEPQMGPPPRNCAFFMSRRKRFFCKKAHQKIDLFFAAFFYRLRMA